MQIKNIKKFTINTTFNKLHLFALYKYYNTLSSSKQKLNMSRHYPPLNQEWKDNTYEYNNNSIINSTTKNLTANKVIHNYFNISSNKIKLRKRKLSRSKLKVFSRPELYLSSANIKETNDKAIITIYIFLRNNRVQLDRFLNFYKKYILKRILKIKHIRRIKHTKGIEHIRGIKGLKGTKRKVTRLTYINKLMYINRLQRVCNLDFDVPNYKGRNVLNSINDNKDISNSGYVSYVNKFLFDNLELNRLRKVNKSYLKTRIAAKCKKSVFERKQSKLTAILGNKAKRRSKHSYRLINDLTDSIYHSPVKNVFKTIYQRKKTRRKLKVLLKNNYFWKDIQYPKAIDYFVSILKKNSNYKYWFLYCFLWSLLSPQKLVPFVEENKENKNIIFSICKLFYGPSYNAKSGVDYISEKKIYGSSEEKLNEKSKSFIMWKPEYKTDILFKGSDKLLNKEIKMVLLYHISERIKSTPKFSGQNKKKLLKKFINDKFEKLIYAVPKGMNNAFNGLSMSLYNKHKFKNDFSSLLKTLLYNIYQKKVELNLVNLKYLNLNSDILTKSIIVKLRDKKSNTRRVLSKALKSGGIAKMSYKNLFINKKNQFKYKLDSYKSYDYTDIVNSKKSNYNLELFNNLSKKTNIWNKTTDNDVINNYTQNSFHSLKYKWITGIRLEARGRLSNRSGASRARFYLKYKGSLRNMDYLNNYNKKLPSSLVLRNVNMPNVQYAYKSSERRIGTFGVKGWISSN